jgi:hypothetical protein
MYYPRLLAKRISTPLDARKHPEKTASSLHPSGRSRFSYFQTLIFLAVVDLNNNPKAV